MNAVRYAHFVTAETSRPSDSRGVNAPLKAHPRKHARSFDEMREDASKRFSNILAKLAK
jgi:hypothetical protein